MQNTLTLEDLIARLIEIRDAPGGHGLIDTSVMEVLGDNNGVYFTLTNGGA